jgi:acetyl-CoA carboxylase biotin carboxylase subunit
VWAETREAAVARLSRVLDEYVIEGINTTVPFFRAIVRDSEFMRGEFDTGFIDRFLTVDAKARRANKGADDVQLADLAAIASVLYAKSSATGPDAAPRTPESRWKLEARLAQRR